MKIKFFSLLLLILFLSWPAYSAITFFIAETYCSTNLNSTLNRDKSPASTEINKSINLYQGNAEYYVKLAHNFTNKKETIAAHEKPDKNYYDRIILKNWKKAVTHNPVNAWYWYKTGIYIIKAHYRNLSHKKENIIRQADLSMKFAEKLHPNDMHLQFALCKYWIWRSTIMPEGNRTQKKFVDKNITNKTDYNKQTLFREIPESKKDCLKKFQKNFN